MGALLLLKFEDFSTRSYLTLTKDHNNLHNFDTWIFFKWIFKTFVAVLILSNTLNIVMAVFGVSRHVIQQSAGLIQGSTAVTPDVLNEMQAQPEAMELRPFLGIFLQSFFVQFTMTALNIVIFVIVYWRMIEIYLMTSLAAIYAVLVQSIATDGDMMNAIWTCVGYTVLLCFVPLRPGACQNLSGERIKWIAVKFDVEFHYKSGYTKGKKGECDYA